MPEVWGEVNDRASIEEWAADYFPDHEVVLWDDLDDAFIGVVSVPGSTVHACYDEYRIAEILMTRDGMTDEEAAEYIDYNIRGAWVGDTTPVLLFRFHQ
jgi:hypothetical protein